MDYIPSITIPPAAIEWTLYGMTFLPLLLACYYLKFLAMWAYQLVMD